MEKGTYKSDSKIISLQLRSLKSLFKKKIKSKKKGMSPLAYQNKIKFGADCV